MKVHRVRSSLQVAFIASAVLAGGCHSGPGDAGAGAGRAADAAPPRLADRPAGAHLRNQHADLASPINSGNVGQMRLAWQVETDTPVSHRPLVGNGRVYFADWGGAVYAVDASSGRQIWKKQVEQPKKVWPWHGFAGTGALGGDMLFEASTEGNAFGLDADTGEVIWTQKITDDPQAGSISELLYHDGLVYIGLSSVEEVLDKKMDKKIAGQKGFEPNFQGRVIALDAKTGERTWERPLATAPHNGATMWSSFALDPEMGALFFTTSNNYTGAANDLSDAVVAVNAKTGEVLWAKQVTQHDVWTKENPIGPDYAFGAGPQLFEAGGRQLVGAGQKSGVFWAFDRKTGELVWYTTVGYGGLGGGTHGEASFGDGVVYVWSNNGYVYGKPPRDFPLNVKALDAATGKHVWVKHKAQPAALDSAGFLASDVYFVASADGKVRAYNASDGTALWTSPGHASVTSSLWVSGNTLLFGTGNPKMFGVAGGPTGVFAYTAGPSPSPLAAP